MPFITTNIVNQAYYQDEFQLIVVYGPLGFGKSAFAMKVATEIYGDYEKVKNYVVFHPKDFVERCLRMSEQQKRDKLLIWDDAGLWLFYMQFTDPFVQAVIKYMNVARTNWAAMILTTPSPAWVAHKLRNFPQNISIKIIKEGSDLKNPSKPRIAKAYRSWVAPDFRHQGVRLMYQDQFSAMLPNDFFWNWYKPLRDTYALEAGQNMQRELLKVNKKVTPDLEEAIVHTKPYTI